MPFQFKEVPRVFPDMPMWGCVARGFTFMISLDEGEYQASAKPAGATPFDGTSINLGEHHKTFDSAQQACVDFIYKRGQ